MIALQVERVKRRLRRSASYAPQENTCPLPAHFWPLATIAQRLLSRTFRVQLHALRAQPGNTNRRWGAGIALTCRQRQQPLLRLLGRRMPHFHAPDGWSPQTTLIMILRTCHLARAGDALQSDLCTDAAEGFATTSRGLGEQSAKSNKFLYCKLVVALTPRLRIIEHHHNMTPRL